MCEVLVHSKLEYSLPTGMLTKKTLQDIQRKLYEVEAKLAYGIPAHTAREVLHYPPQNGGLDLRHVFSSLTAQTKLACELALNDQGRLGRLCRPLVHTIFAEHAYDRAALRTRSANTRRQLWLTRMSLLLAADCAISYSPGLTTPKSGGPDIDTIHAAAMLLQPCAKKRIKIYEHMQLITNSHIRLYTNPQLPSSWAPAKPTTQHAKIAIATLTQCHNNNPRALQTLYNFFANMHQPRHITPAPTLVPPPSSCQVDAPTATDTDIFATHSLFHTLVKVHAARHTDEGDTLYLCEWKPGVCHNKSIPPEAAPLVDRFEDHARLKDVSFIHWRRHWAPSSCPHIAKHAAAQDFAEQAPTALPPPPLGHPLPDPPALQHASVQIIFKELHPDFDTAATGAARIIRTPDADYYYDEHGHLQGSLPHTKTDDLWQRYNKHKHGANPEPTLLPFAEEACHLLKRYRNKAKSDTGTRVNLRNHWATPGAVQQALIDAFGITTEIFASPLNVHPATQSYHSAYARDAVFGATHDAYSAVWTGAVQLNPEYEPADLLKAVKWAQASAASCEEPFFAVGVLPKWTSQAFYQEYCSHPHSHVLTTIKKAYFNFTKATYIPSLYSNNATDPFETADAHAQAADNSMSEGEEDAPNDEDNSSPSAPHAHWPVDIVLFYNAAGLQRYYSPDGARALHRALAEHAAHTNPPQAGTTAHSHLQHIMRTVITMNHPPQTASPLPSKDKRRARRWAKRHMAGLPTMPTQHSTPQPPAVPTHPPVEPRQALPTAYNPEAIVYTDASKRPNSTGMGCGIYIPAHKGNDPRTISKFAPGEKAHIIKGELLSIWHALKAVRLAPGTHIHILTDSLTALYLLSRALHRPWSLHSVYESLTHDIIKLAREHDGPVTIQKVRAHIGVRGNEAADRLADAGYNYENDDTMWLFPPPDTSYTHFQVLTPAVTQTDTTIGQLTPQTAGAQTHPDGSDSSHAQEYDSARLYCPCCGHESTVQPYELLCAYDALCHFGFTAEDALDELEMSECCLQELEKLAPPPQPAPEPEGNSHVKKCSCCTATHEPLLQIETGLPPHLKHSVEQPHTAARTKKDIVRHHVQHTLLLKPKTKTGARLAGANARNTPWTFTTDSYDTMHEKGKHRMRHTTRANALTIRYGGFIGRKMQVLRGKLPEGVNKVNCYCRLCWTAHDTGYHMLGGCKDFTMNNIITDRGNQPVRAIEAEIRKGRHGGYKLLIHGGKSTEDQAPCTSTVPPYILPDCSLCPDLMLLRGLHDGHTRRRYSASRRTQQPPALETLPQDAKAHITLIPAEVTVCCDDYVKSAVARKHEKYKQLMADLRAAGWRVLGQNDDGSISDTGPYVITLPFGNTGITYTPTLRALQELGIPAPKARTLQKNISRMVTKTVTTLMMTKRELEARLPPDIGPPCPPSALPYKPKKHETFIDGRPVHKSHARQAKAAAGRTAPPAERTGEGAGPIQSSRTPFDPPTLYAIPQHLHSAPEQTHAAYANQPRRTAHRRAFQTPSVPNKRTRSHAQDNRAPKRVHAQLSSPDSLAPAPRRSQRIAAHHTATAAQRAPTSAYNLRPSTLRSQNTSSRSVRHSAHAVPSAPTQHSAHSAHPRKGIGWEPLP
jgi:ribonuclease HI